MFIMKFVIKIYAPSKKIAHYTYFKWSASEIVSAAFAMLS